MQENGNIIHVSDSSFEKEVLRPGVPVVVDFYADWCGPCRMVAPTMERLSREYAGKAVFAKLNTDDNQSTAMKYDVMSIPTVMVFADGVVKQKMIGAAPESQYRNMIDSVLK
ncbi:MAG: thioredoxin [Nitrososphaerota archaeon]|nr:thioredoxin [Nitrososphaerota archaeon]MDG6940014.1 thioredoxin [Nitrososphaerota archaeon]